MAAAATTMTPAGRGRAREAGCLLLVLAWALIACRAGPGPQALRQAAAVEGAVAVHRQPPVEADTDLLLIGTSTISLWNTDCSFPGRKVVKRGLSGAMIDDIDSNLDALLGPVAPRQVLLYAGENDLASGAEPEPVSRGILNLVAEIRARHPDAGILVLSIKPAPARAAHWPRAEAVNAVLRTNAAQGGYRVIDIASALLGPGGPEPRYYQADGIHLTPEGYARIDAEIAPHLIGPARDGAAARC